MNRAFSFSLAFLLICGGIYWQHVQNAAAAPRVDPIAEYERQLARGVAERLIALNRLGKAEALSLHAWKMAELEANNSHSEGRADLFRSLFSNRFLFEMQEISNREKSRRLAYERAQERRKREKQEISAARQEVMGWDFRRYTSPSLSSQ